MVRVEPPRRWATWDANNSSPLCTRPRRRRSKNVIHECYTWLVVWNMFLFFYILGMSSSQLTFILFRGVGGSTTNQIPWLIGFSQGFPKVFRGLSQIFRLCLRTLQPLAGDQRGRSGGRCRHPPRSEVVAPMENPP